MKGYKAFDKGLKCRGFQYEVGNVAEEQGKPEVCNRGLHFCAKPLDVLNYYDYIPGETEFAEVEAVGDIATEGDKSSTNKLLIKAKLTFWDLFKINFKMVLENVESKENISSTTGDEAHSSTTGNYAHSSTTGNYAHSSTTGYKAHSSTTGDEAHSSTTGNYAHSSTTGNYAHSSTTGNYAHSSTTGDEAHSSTTGYKAHSSTTGNYAHSSTTGYKAHSSTTGNYAHSSTTGNYAHSSTTGKHSISSAIGIQAKAKVVEGWLVLADWKYNEDSYKWELNKVITAKVGDTVDGVTIEPNVYYFYKDGELKEVR